MNKELLRRLPKTDKLLEMERCKELVIQFSRENIVLEIRKALDFYRKEIIENQRLEPVNEEELLNRVEKELNKTFESTLKNVINGTGVIIHTNLGRSLLSEKAIESMLKVSKSYNNLEYNLEAGGRGSRYVHVEELLKTLTGASGAVVVNNNAAAVMLVLSEIAKGKEAIVSRGELVEIGGSFRIPDVMEISGSKLVEVGTTNRTHDYDYERAITEETGALLKVHSSNFKIIGFTLEVTSQELSEIGKKHNIPTIEDLGSGALVDLKDYGITEEKTVKDVIDAGIDIVTFSGDKLLGGPQAGIIVGKKEYIDRIKKNQLLRALRVDKFTLAALEGTLFSYLNSEKVFSEIPTLKMLSTTMNELEEKGKILKEILEKVSEKVEVKIENEFDYIGGGTLPMHTINSLALSIKYGDMEPQALERYLRGYKTPIITRVSGGKVLIHLRTLKACDFEVIGEAIERLKI